jgi:hypothetical protein
MAFQTKTDALYYLGMNVKQILDFGEGGRFVHEDAETMKFVQIVNAIVKKADEEPLLKRLMSSVKKTDHNRMFGADGGSLTMYELFVALRSSDTCGMMAQGVLKGYISAIKELNKCINTPA